MAKVAKKPAKKVILKSQTKTATKPIKSSAAKPAKKKEIVSKVKAKVKAKVVVSAKPKMAIKKPVVKAIKKKEKFSDSLKSKTNTSVQKKLSSLKSSPTKSATSKKDLKKDDRKMSVVKVASKLLKTVASKVEKNKILNKAQGKVSASEKLKINKIEKVTSEKEIKNAKAQPALAKVASSKKEIEKIAKNKKNDIPVAKNSKKKKFKDDEFEDEDEDLEDDDELLGEELDEDLDAKPKKRIVSEEDDNWDEELIKKTKDSKGSKKDLKDVDFDELKKFDKYNSSFKKVEAQINEEIEGLREHFDWSQIAGAIATLDFFVDHQNDECIVRGCDNLRTTQNYCRIHYITHWEEIQKKREILKQGKLQEYIEELIAKYPPKFIDAIMGDLSDEKEFYRILGELNIFSNFDFEDEEFDAEADDDAEDEIPLESVGSFRYDDD